MIHQHRIKQILLQQAKISEKELATLFSEARNKHINVLTYLVNQKVIGQQDLYRLLAADFGVPFIDLKNITLNKSLLEILPEAIVQTHEVIVFEHNTTNNIIKIATTDPDDLQTIDFIKKKTGANIQVYLTTQESIDHVIKQYHGHIAEELAAFQQPLQNTNELSASDIARDVPIIKIVDTILDYAIFQNASDIHIEPAETNIVIRFRIDGILREVMTLPKTVQPGLIARVKILASLKLDEHRLPQDGRINLVNDKFKVAIRVSVLPVFDGEKVVMRILDESKNILTLEQLGLNTMALPVVQRNIAKPHGMILVTGPTGSGKTTSLYTILNILNTSGVNISTVEDPIEYRMPRVNQSQINPKIGFTFASGLRTLLRQDPNIIMVGEIRDNETAEIAAHAAMTGHLVLSTLHTNDSVGTIARITEMGVPHFLVASTINLIIAQRLVRKICTNCIQSYQLSKKTLEELSKQYNLANLLDGLIKLGETVPAETQALNELNFYRGHGCRNCSDTGYHGRLGIYEVLEITPAISQAILQQASKTELLAIAQKENMISIAQDGFAKAKHGLTTIEEILRVTKE
ncbi:MAG: ATPase, T2SS/T4P/T4SS family [Patescibacteria group bacterium]|jgi:type IV pilus assembly protein PilB